MQSANLGPDSVHGFEGAAVNKTKSLSLWYWGLGQPERGIERNKTISLREETGVEGRITEPGQEEILSLRWEGIAGGS